MSERIRSHLTYANAMSTIAVFAVLGGGAYAATVLPKNSVGTKQLKKNAVTSPKVKDGTLLSKDFKAGQLPAGAKGDKGDAGAPGATGATGAAGATGQTGATGPSTGAAGGDLTGSYPNPTLKAGAVETAALVDGAVTAAKLARADSAYSNQEKETSIEGTQAFQRVDFDVPPISGGMTVSTAMTGQNSIDIDEDGLYLVTGYGRWPSATGGAYRQLVVTLDAASDINILNDVSNSVASGAEHVFNGVVPAVAGDKIIATATHDAGAATFKTIEFFITAVRISG